MFVLLPENAIQDLRLKYWRTDTHPVASDSHSDIGGALQESEEPSCTRRRSQRRSCIVVASHPAQGDGNLGTEAALAGIPLKNEVALPGDCAHLEMQPFRY